MMNLICAIPEHIGWVIVGAVGTLTIGMGGLLIDTVVNMIRDRLRDDDEESEVS